MLVALLSVLCWTLLCPGPCNSQHLCDIERWVSDNDMPINRLDISTTSKTKLVQSIRSDGKLIKCSELRLIHREAELDRPFRQGRYKLNSRRSSRQATDRRATDSETDSDGPRSDRRFDSRQDGTDDRPDDSFHRNDDDRLLSKSDDTGEAQSDSWSDQQAQSEPPIEGKNESKKVESQVKDAPTTPSRTLDNSSEQHKTANKSVHHLNASNTFSISHWHLHCFTCLSSTKLASRSWKMCRIFDQTNGTIRSSGALPKQPTDRVAMPLFEVCYVSFLGYRNKSILLCEAFRWGKRNATPTGMSSNGTSLQNQTAESTVVEDIGPVPAANEFVLSCLQCSTTRRAEWAWHNRTRRLCIFVAEPEGHQSALPSERSSPEEEQKQHLADKLQFIDGSVAGVAGKSEKTDEEELGDAGQPTRARHAVHHQVHNKDQVNTSYEGELPAEAAAKQLETLSHSAFMEKLFDALMSRRKKSSNATMGHVNSELDRLNSTLEKLTNLTSRKANGSDVEELRYEQHRLELRLTNLLARLQQRMTRRMDQRMQKLEVDTSKKISACVHRLNGTNASLQSTIVDQSRQLSNLRSRLARLSRRLTVAEEKCKKASLQPEVPPMFRQAADTSGLDSLHQVGHDLLQGQAMAAGVTVPNVNGKSPISDCSDIRDRSPESVDGVFTANLGLPAASRVRCDMTNGGWTYILSRSDGKVDFFRNWTSYRLGFGDPSGEHFVGLDALAEMTQGRRYKLWIVLEDWEGAVKNVSYGSFQVLGERQSYQLLVDHFSGDPTVGDSLSSHSNAPFSTFDSDNDLVEKKFGGNCAKRFRGGFWYFSCYRANPTGQYYSGGRIPNKRCDGIVWKTWKGPHYSLRSIRMKIRPV